MDPAPSAVRRWAGALSLPLLFAALIGAGFADPLDDRAPAAEQVQQAVGHLPQLQLTFLFELLAAGLMIAVTMTIVGAVRSRGSAVANAGAVLGTLGGIGLCLIAMGHVYLDAILASGTADGAAILAARDAGAGVLGPLIFAAPLAVVVLAMAALRARLVPWPVLVIIGVFLVLEFVPVLPGDELFPLLAGLVAYTWIALRIVAPDRVGRRIYGAADPHRAPSTATS